MPIEIKMTGMCEDCDLANLYLETTELEAWDGSAISLPEIHCEHEQVCDMWNKFNKSRSYIKEAEEAYEKFKKQNKNSHTVSPSDTSYYIPKEETKEANNKYRIES